VVTVDPEAPADPVVAAEAVVTAAPAAPEVSEAPDVTAAPPTAVEPADQPDPVAMAPDSPPPDIPPADGLPADEPPAEAVPAAAVDLAADGPADPGPADGGKAPVALGVPAKLPVPLPAIEIVIGSRALATPVDEVTAEYPTVALPPDEPPPPDAGPAEPGPRPARRGMSRRTIVGAVALSSVVIAATGAIAHVINPDLARMPPIMRVPKEPKPQAAPAPLVAPANPSPSPSARPKPKQTKATVVPTTPGSPVNAPPTGPTTEAFLLAAEAEGAEHSSQPRPRAVAGASGGQVMGHLGQFDEYLRFRFTVPTAGQYTVTVYYCGGEARPMRVRVNDNSIRENGTSALSFGATGSWDTVGSRAFQVTLRAGANTVELWNVNPNWAPDIDRLTVTR